ncbi:MAG TPA: S-layer homology domain-containing protein [Candidatus Absconditabacterales bacterium]|nr:S-layer homology domain-containing protein [Candidatus Absconditabacterales bacterium]
MKKNFFHTNKIKLLFVLFLSLGLFGFSFALLTLTTPIVTPTADDTPSFQFSSDFETGSITYSGGCVGDIASIDATGTYTVNYNILSDGIYNCAIIIDGATLSINQFEVDTTGPNISFTNDAEVGPVQSDTIALDRGDASVMKRDYDADGSCSTLAGDYSNTYTVSLVENTASNNGQYICFYGEDALGNISTLSTSNDLNIDISDPTYSGVTSGSYYSGNIAITYSDTNISGATLNGNSYNSGDTVSSEGTYVFVVSDLAGNFTGATFTIDKTDPDVLGVSDGSYYNSDKVITYSDTNISGATMDGTGFPSGSTISSTGSHTLIVEDLAGNSTTITFYIDKTYPTYGDISDGTYYNTTVNPTYSDANSVSATLNGVPFNSGDPVSVDNPYTLIITDIAGNSVTVNFVVDKTDPTYGGFVDGSYYNTDVTIAYSDTNISGATLNGSGISDGYIETSEGLHTLVVIDLATNSDTASFTIDKTYPSYNGVVDGSYYSGSVAITYSDDNLSTATLNGAPYASGDSISTDDDYVFYIDDLAGNSHTISFVVDTISPTASVSYSPATLTNTDVIATLTGANEIIIIDSVGGSGHTFTGNDTHLFQFHDLAGNTGEVLATVDWIDKIPPQLTGTSVITTNNSNTGYSKAGDTIMITFSVTEDLMSNPAVEIDGGGVMSFMGEIDNTYIYSRNMTSGDPDGVISINISMEDLATNTNSESEASTIVFDKTAPAGISIITPSNEQWLKGSNGVDPSINFEITRSAGTETNYGSKPLQIQYSSLGDFSDTYNISTGTENDGSYLWTIPAGYNTDTALIRIMATDLAGNSTTFVGNSFNIDSIKPTEITITTPNGLEYLKGGDEYDISYNGGVESNIASKQYSLYRAGIFNRNLSVTPQNKRIVPSDLNSQNMTMKITVTDQAGWFNDGDSLEFTIDNTDPILSFSNNSTWTNSTIVGNTSVSDNFALRLTGSVAVYKDTAFTSSCNGGTLTVPTYSSDGTYTSYACVADRAGNVITGQQTYNIDKTNPFVNAGLDQIVNGVSTQDTDIYDVLSGGVMSDIDTILRSQISGPGTASFNPSDTGNTDITASADGDYVLQLTVSDNAGNTGSDTINFTRDTVDPVITGSTVTNTNTSSPAYSFQSNETGYISYSGLCANGNISSVSIGTNSFHYSSRGEATYNNCKLIISDLAGNQVVHNVPSFTVSIPSGGGGGGGGGSRQDDCELPSDLPGANEEGVDYSDSRYDDTCLAEIEDEEEEEEEDELEELEEEVIELFEPNIDKSYILSLINIPSFDDSTIENSMPIISDYISDKIIQRIIPDDEIDPLVYYFNSFLSNFADYKNNGNEAAQDEAIQNISTFMSHLNNYSEYSIPNGSDELSNAISFLYQNGLTIYSDKSSFMPDTFITREQAAKFLSVYAEDFKQMSPDLSKTFVFTDINDGDPTLRDYITKSYQMGIFNGYGSVFKPHWNLTKGGAIAVLLRIHLGESLNEYNYPRYKEYYLRAKELGITNDPNIRNFDSNITRGELALFIYRISQQ